VSCSDVWSTDYNIAQLGSEVDGVLHQTKIPGYPVFSSSKSYSFPINSSLHYIVARGGLSSGVVVVRGSESVDRERIGVEVVARYYTRRALTRARLCELEKPEGGIGLGIYVSDLSWTRVIQKQTICSRHHQAESILGKVKRIAWTLL
jgi:hypothetical protein